MVALTRRRVGTPRINKSDRIQPAFLWIAGALASCAARHRLLPCHCHFPWTEARLHERGQREAHAPAPGCRIRPGASRIRLAHATASPGSGSAIGYADSGRGARLAARIRRGKPQADGAARRARAPGATWQKLVRSRSGRSIIWSYVSSPWLIQVQALDVMTYR